MQSALDFVPRLTRSSVSEPSVEIIGGPDLYINRGSNANLTCVISGGYNGPNNVRWTHNNKVRPMVDGDEQF